MLIKFYEMEMEVVRQMFYSDETMFGIYAMKPVEYTTELSFNSYYNVSLQGRTRRLSEGDTYLVRFEGVHTHPKYGAYYEIIEVEADKLDTISEQDSFLSTILTKNQFNSLKEAYPNKLLVDLITNNQIDTGKTKGIKKASLAVIREKVIKNASVSLLIARLNELSLSTNALGRILEHYIYPEAAIQAIEQNIYNLCDVEMYGFLTVDKIALGRGDNPTSKERIRACIDYLLKRDNNSGHTWSDRDTLRTEMTNLLEISTHFIDQELQTLVSNHKYHIEDDKVAYRHIYKQEREVYAHLKRIQRNYVVPNVVDAIAEEKILRIEKGQGFSFTEEQKHVILDGVRHGVMTVNGKAGTGKSAIVVGLMKFMDDPHYVTCALSGVAVKILDLRGISSATIHRMLKYKHGEGFTHNDRAPMSYDVVVVDEISMVAIPLFLSVLKAVKDGGKLIISGDSGQLSGIGVGNAIRDLLETNAFTSYELTKVHRQAAKSGVLTIANQIREGNQIVPYGSTGKEVFGELQDMVVASYSNKEYIPHDILRIASSYKSKVKSPEDLMEFQVIVPNRERGNLNVRTMNIELQNIFNPSQREGLKRNGYEYRENDKVMAQGNSYNIPLFEDLDDYEAHREELAMIAKMEESGIEVDKSEFPQRDTVIVYNGTSGYIHDIVNKTALVKFSDVDGLVPFSQNELDKIDMGYAITAHRSQGGSFKHVVFAFDYGAYTLLTRQLLYVGITRASEKCDMLCESGALHHAIENDESGKRRTFLRDIIRKDLSGEDIVYPAKLRVKEVDSVE